MFQRTLVVRILLGAGILFLLFLLCILLHFSNFIAVYCLFLLSLLMLFKPLSPLYFLAFILPFFGNNPGGKYSLFFVDEVVILILLRWLTPLFFAKRPSFKGSMLGIWIWLFFFITSVALFPLRYDIRNAFLSTGDLRWFIYNIFTAYAVDFFWSVRLTVDLFLSILFFYYLINTITDLRPLKNLGLCVFSGFFLSLFLGILDFHNIIDLTFLRPLNPDLVRFGYKRLMSLFWHSGWFAEYIVLIAPFFLAPFFLHQPHRRPLLRILLGLMILYAMIFTYQRAGWISFSAALLVLSILGWKVLYLRLAKSRNLLLLIAGILLIVGGFTFIVTSDLTAHTALAQRLKKIFFAPDRTRIWDQALLLYQRKPLLGIGTGNYYYYHCSNFPPGHPYYHFDKVTAHSTYLHILVERGPFGALVFLVLLSLALRRATLGFKLSREFSSRRTLSAALLASLVGFIIYGFAQYMFYIRIIELLFWFLLALTEILGTDIPALAPKPLTHKEKLAMGAFMILILVILSFQPTAHDLFFWNVTGNPEDEFLGSWFDPWDERTVTCDQQVLETKYLLFHPDVRKSPVTVSLLLNGKVMCSQIIRDQYVHQIAALVPRDMAQPLHVRLLTSRFYRVFEAFPQWPKNKRPCHCVGARDVRCRPLGLEGIGFYQWEKADKVRYRWTNSLRALCDIQVTSPVLVLHLLAGNPDLASRPLSVSLLVSDEQGRIILDKNPEFRAEGRGENAVKPSLFVQFPLENHLNKTVRLEIKIGRLFCPLDSGLEDTRMLGIYVSEPLWDSGPPAR